MSGRSSSGHQRCHHTSNDSIISLRRVFNVNHQRLVVAHRWKTTVKACGKSRTNLSGFDSTWSPTHLEPLFIACMLSILTHHRWELKFFASASNLFSHPTRYSIERKLNNSWKHIWSSYFIREKLSHDINVLLSADVVTSSGWLFNFSLKSHERNASGSFSFFSSALVPHFA